MEEDFRLPTNSERLMLDRLLEADFPGKAELAVLLQAIFVRTIDDDGGLEIQTQVDGRARVQKRVPVEAEAKDRDGVVIHVLLHVVEGRPVELEFFREDAATVKLIPPPAEFELIVLPAASRNPDK